MAMVITTAACGSDPVTTKSRTGSSATAASPAQTKSAPASSAPSLGTPLPTAPTANLTVSTAANRIIGAANVQNAWNTLAAWILDAGYRPELVRTTKPTEVQLAPITSLMTDGCRTSFLSYTSDINAANTASLESLTAIGVQTPDGTVLPGDDAVTAQTITTATADIDAQQRLVITASSQANIHYQGETDPTRRFHTTFTRTTTYVLVQQNRRWVVDAWQGTYNTTDPVNE